MGLIVEPFDEIQVWIKGTGACLWGEIVPVVHPEGALVINVTVEPLPDTIRLVEPLVRVHAYHRQHKLGRHAMVVIPKDVIDVIFGDDRHFDQHG